MVSSPRFSLTSATRRPEGSVRGGAPNAAQPCTTAERRLTKAEFCRAFSFHCLLFRGFERAGVCGWEYGKRAVARERLGPLFPSRRVLGLRDTCIACAFSPLPRRESPRLHFYATPLRAAFSSYVAPLRPGWSLNGGTLPWFSITCSSFLSELSCTRFLPPSEFFPRSPFSGAHLTCLLLACLKTPGWLILYCQRLRRRRHVYLRSPV